MIEIIGAPFDLCGSQRGSSLGPGALRIAQIQEVLQGLGVPVEDRGDIGLQWAAEPGVGLRNYAPLEAALKELKDQVSAILSRGALPLILGGEHTLAVGGVSAALDAFDGDLAVLWLDAHADLNTPAVSPSGNLHGMPLAALTHQPDPSEGRVREEWRALCQMARPPLRMDRLGWFGLREVDRGEQQILREQNPGYVSTLYDVDRRGVEAEIVRLDAWLRASGASNLYISFDVDVMDPILAPGTGTAVRGGLTYRETQLAAELLREHLTQEDCPYRLAGLEIVETNPIPDQKNETAVMAVEWLASLFGKTILG